MNIFFAYISCFAWSYILCFKIAKSVLSALPFIGAEKAREICKSSSALIATLNFCFFKEKIAKIIYYFFEIFFFRSNKTFHQRSLLNKGLYPPLWAIIKQYTCINADLYIQWKLGKTFWQPRKTVDVWRNKWHQGKAAYVNLKGWNPITGRNSF